MRRVTVLALLVATGALSLTVAAFQQPPAGQQAPRVVEIDKLKDNLFVMRGGGGNSSVLVTGTGVVVIDTKNPGWGQPLLDAIRKVTDRPVTMIVNTHTHGDHVSGNVEFPAEVDIVTHVNTAANMKEMRPNSSAAPTPNPPNIFRDNNGKGLAKRTFTDRMTKFPNAVLYLCEDRRTDNISLRSGWTVTCPIDEAAGADGWSMSLSKPANSPYDSTRILLHVFVPTEDAYKSVDPTWEHGDTPPTGTVSWQNNIEDTDGWHMIGG